MNFTFKIIVIFLILVNKISSNTIKLASSYYPPPAIPHPQTGYPWVCSNWIDPSGRTPRNCQHPGIYILFSTVPQPYRVPSRIVNMPVFWIGQSESSVSSRYYSHSSGDFNRDRNSIFSCYMRFPSNYIDKETNYDSRPPMVEAALLTMFATLKNKQLGYLPERDELVFDDNGRPFDILRTFYNMDINAVAGKHVDLIQGNSMVRVNDVMHMIDQTNDEMEVESNVDKNSTKYLFPDGILYSGNIVLDGNYNDFSQRKTKNGKCNSDEEEKVDNKKPVTNPIKFKLLSANSIKLYENKVNDLYKEAINSQNKENAKNETTPKPGIWSKIGSWFKRTFSVSPDIKKRDQIVQASKGLSPAYEKDGASLYSKAQNQGITVEEYIKKNPAKSPRQLVDEIKRGTYVDEAEGGIEMPVRSNRFGGYSWELGEGAVEEAAAIINAIV